MRGRVRVEMLAVLAMVLLAPSVTEALVMNKCELRQQLNLTLLAGHINEVAKIVCQAELSSRLNTSAVNQIHVPHWDASENKDDHSHPGPSVQPNVSKSPPAPGDRPAPGGRPGAPGQKNRNRRSAPGNPKHSPPPHQTGQNTSDHSHPGASPSSPLAPHNKSQGHASGPDDHKPKSPKPSSAPINNSAPGVPKHPSQEHPTIGNQTGQHKDDHSHPGPSVQPNVSKSPPAPGDRPAPGGHPGAPGQKNRHRRSAPQIPKHSPLPPNKPQDHGNQNNNNHSHPGASPSSPLAPHNESHEHASGPGNRKTRSPKPSSSPSKNPPSHNHQPASPKPEQPKPSPESIKPSSSKSPPPGGKHPKPNGRKSRSLKGQQNNQGFPKPDSRPHNESSEHQHHFASFIISLVNQTIHHDKQGHDQGHGGRKSRSVKPVGETSHEQRGDDTWTLYGLFQLADRIACLSDKPSLNLCRLSCDKLIDDDITDDIACVETIIGNKMSTINDHRKELIKSMYDLLHQKECANVVDLPYFSSC